MPPAGGKKGVFRINKEKHHMHFEMTPEQYQLLSTSARTCGLSKRAYLVQIIEGNVPKVRSSDEVKALRTEIHRIGNNINQIARSVNSGIAKQEDVRYAIELLGQVYKLMYEIAKR